ncbi:glucosyl transferase GtrII family protein [Serratia liquefaciens]|uniref:glucosyl transferase GtrII family protein n=1 Tax=Serratia liquefaciens TaxID=614 RepID=UPI0039059FE2
MNKYIESKILHNNKVIALFYFAAIFLVYCPTILFNYAFSDDWSTLEAVFSGVGSPFQWDIQSGRPLYAVARHFGFMLVHSMNDLVYLRIFTMISIMALSLYLFLFVDGRLIFDSQLTRATFPLLICFIPALQVYSAWATCFPFVLSILLSGFSYSILIPKNKKTSIARCFFSVIMLWLAFSIYQPTAMSFLFFAMLDNCFRKNQNLTTLNISLIAMILSAGMVGSLILSKFLPVWMYGSSLPRSEITNDLYGKIHWFIKEPLVNAINNFNISPTNFFTIFSSILIIAGMISIVKSEAGKLKLLAFISMGIGAYTPNLLIAESWAAFRSLIALEIFTCTIVFIGLTEIAKKLKITELTTYVVMLLVMTSASYNIIGGFIIPQKSELMSLSSAISNKVEKSYTGELMFDIGDPAYNAFSITQRYDEFGNISLATPWAIKGMAEQIRLKKSMNFKLTDDVILKYPEQCKSNCITIKTGNAMRDSTVNY